MGAKAAFERWYILRSADAMASHSYTTEDIVTLKARGALSERAVVYPMLGGRREAITVAELIAAHPDVLPRTEPDRPYR